MPRKKRIWYPGATYHVMSRGNRKTPIFKERYDYIHFIKLLKTIMGKYPFKLHGICLMTNHFHLALETKDIELWKIMQRILSLYAEAFNFRHSYTGHLFQGRYTACLIKDERYFLEVSRYIHLNPVRAMLADRPSDYEYSSYNLYVPLNLTRQQEKMNNLLEDIIDTTLVLSHFQENSMEQYRAFVEGPLSHEEQELLIQKDIRENDLWIPV